MCDMCTEMLHLEREVFRYHYLSQGGCSYVLTMDDDKQFTTTIVRILIHMHIETTYIRTDLRLLCTYIFSYLPPPPTESYGGDWVQPRGH